MTAARPFSKGILLWPESSTSFDLEYQPKPFATAGKIAHPPMLKVGIFETSIYLRSNTTLFTRAGWRFPWAVCGLALVATVFALRKTRPRRGSVAGANQPRAKGLPSNPRSD